MATVAIAAAACGQTDRERATELASDLARPPAEALVAAARVIWPDRDDLRHTISAEPRGAGWRVLVIVDRPGTPVIEERGDELVLTFHQVLDGGWVTKSSDMSAAGRSRKVTEVLIADRYHVDVRGRPTTVVAPIRTVQAPDGMSAQSFNTWEAADLAKLQPYDLVMNERGTLVMPR